MKTLDPHAIITESMAHYLQGKCYNSETFISYVARDVRAHGDKFTTEDRAICKKVAEEKIEEIVEALSNPPVDGYDYAELYHDLNEDSIWGEIDGKELDLKVKYSKFLRVYYSGSTEVEKSFAKKQLTKAFLGK